MQKKYLQNAARIQLKNIVTTLFERPTMIVKTCNASTTIGKEQFLTHGSDVSGIWLLFLSV